MRPFFNLIIFYHKFNQRQKQTPAPFAAFCLTESDNENVCSFQRELKCHSVFTHQAENECRCLDAKNHLNMQNHLNMHHNQLRHADGCGSLELSSAEARHHMKMFMLPAPSVLPSGRGQPLVSHAFLSRLGTQPESSGTAPKSISLPHSLPGQQTEVT